MSFSHINNEYNRLTVLENAGADTTMNNKAVLVGNGSKMTRLMVDNCQDSAFHIACYPINTQTWAGRLVYAYRKKAKQCVEISIDNKRYLVKINSIANRLFVNPEQVKLAAEGDFYSFLSLNTQMASEILTNYEEVTKNFTTDGVNGLKLKSHKNIIKNKSKYTSINLPLLMEVVSTLVKKSHEPHVGNNDNITSGSMITIQGRTFIAKKEKYLHLTLMEDATTKTTFSEICGQHLGAGGYGEVLSGLNLNTGEIVALKIASAIQIKPKEEKEEKEEKAEIRIQTNVVKEALLEEYDNVRLVNPFGNIYGLQRPATVIYDINQEDKKLFVMEMPCYEHDYAEELIRLYKNESHSVLFKNLMIGCYQLLNGLKELTALKRLRNNNLVTLLHSDIKLFYNILFEKDEQGRLLVHIADFGGTRIIPRDNNKLHHEMIRSACCASNKDLKQRDAFFKLIRKNPEQAEALLTRIGEIDKKSMVYAMGTVLRDIIYNKEAPDLQETCKQPSVLPDNPDNLCDIALICCLARCMENDVMLVAKESQVSDFPRAFKELIERMRGDSELRPSAEEALDSFETILGLHSHNLLNEIRMMKADYETYYRRKYLAEQRQT